MFSCLGLEDTEEKMSVCLANQQEKDRSQSLGEGENYDAESEEDEPTGKESVSKSKVNSFVFLKARIPV